MNESRDESNGESSKDGFESNATNNKRASNGEVLDQLKACIPTLQDLQLGLSAAITTTVGLVQNRATTLSNAAAEDLPWATQVRVYLVPLLLLSSVAAFVNGSILGYTLPFPLVGTMKEPIFSGFIFHFAKGIGAIVSITVGAWLVTKFVVLSDGMTNVLSLLRTTLTPALLASSLVVLGALGTLALLVTGVFGLLCLWEGSKIMSERNPAITAPKFIGFTLLACIITGLIMAVLLSPLAPFELSSQRQL